MSYSNKSLTYAFSPRRSQAPPRPYPETIGYTATKFDELARLALPMPPGFTVTTEAYRQWTNASQTIPQTLKQEVSGQISRLQKTTGREFSNPNRPLFLTALRSAEERNLPPSFCHLGINDKTVKALAKLTGSECLAYRSYFQTILRFAFELSRPGQFVELDRLNDINLMQLPAHEVQVLCQRAKSAYAKSTGFEFPQEPEEQIYLAIRCIYKQWAAESQGKLLGLVFHETPIGRISGMTGWTILDTQDRETGADRFSGNWHLQQSPTDVIPGVGREISSEAARKLMPQLFQELRVAKSRLEFKYRVPVSLKVAAVDGELKILGFSLLKDLPNSLARTRTALSMAKRRVISEKKAVEKFDIDGANAGLWEWANKLWKANWLESQGRLLATISETEIKDDMQAVLAASRNAVERLVVNECYILWAVGSLSENDAVALKKCSGLIVAELDTAFEFPNYSEAHDICLPWLVAEGMRTEDYKDRIAFGDKYASSGEAVYFSSQTKQLFLGVPPAKKDWEVREFITTQPDLRIAQDDVATAKILKDHTTTS